MIYTTKESACRAADMQNSRLGYASSYPVIDEQGHYRVVCAFSIERWLASHSLRQLIA